MQSHLPSYPPQRLLFFFQSQLNTLKASSGPGLPHSLFSNCYNNCHLLFMRPKFQINCFETLSSWSPRAPESNFMDFMTKWKKEKKKEKSKGQTFCTKSFDYCDLSIQFLIGRIAQLHLKILSS